MAQTVQFNFMDMNLENGEDIRISNENVDCRMRGCKNSCVYGK